ncbi:hypothetical protein L2E82_35692 [Cichorium intybus]|uniref:Uncharacterized protein n=1 Tax=Cichorium intybus TaxID=13427 RepID=A0ACB9BPJ6_CICIN|nr:hypothetical protein L2E82_35692 [Cichorium intybus]
MSSSGANLESFLIPLNEINLATQDFSLELAYECISYDSQKRPTMGTIMKRIEDAIEFQVTGDPLGFGDFGQDDYEVSKPPSLTDTKATLPTTSDAISKPPSFDDMKATSTTEAIRRGALAELDRWTERMKS